MRILSEKEYNNLISTMTEATIKLIQVDALRDKYKEQVDSLTKEIEFLKELLKQKLLNNPDIRNKLTPMKNLCALIDIIDLSNNCGDLIKTVMSEVEQCKNNIEYLSGNIA